MQAYTDAGWSAASVIALPTVVPRLKIEVDIAPARVGARRRIGSPVTPGSLGGQTDEPEQREQG